MEQMVVDKIQQSRTMYHLSSILDQVTEYGVSYEQNEQIWESIYKRTLELSSSEMTFQREPFENIISNLSSKTEHRPSIIDQLSSLLE